MWISEPGRPRPGFLRAPRDCELQSEANISTASAPPDWDQVGEIPCPLCEYNLYGLTVPRCPECGYRFDWLNLLDPRRRLHPYLFEQHQECNFKSFWRTAWGGLRPGRFWTTLHPWQPSRPRRLILYWCLALSVHLLACCVDYLGEGYRLHAVYATARSQLLQEYQRAFFARFITQTWGSIEACIDARFPRPTSLNFWRNVARNSRELGELALSLGAVAIWPWMTVAALMVFRWSMRRVRVRSAHVLRCVLYSADASLWVGVAVIVLTVIRFAIMGAGPIPGQFVTWWGRLVVATLLVAVYRLAVAYRRYMQFDRPVWTVLASQIMVLLVYVNLGSILYVIWNRP